MRRLETRDEPVNEGFRTLFVERLLIAFREVESLPEELQISRTESLAICQGLRTDMGVGRQG